MFLDTSAILAILLREEDAFIFCDKIRNARRLYYSSMGAYEVVAHLVYTCDFPPKNPQEARFIFSDFMSECNACYCSITSKEHEFILEAFLHYGKGTGHKAQLNMGDCFSYACAKTLDAPLLFKGNDFIHTDIEQAI